MRRCRSVDLDRAVYAFFAQAPWPSLAPVAHAFALVGSIQAWWLLVAVLVVRKKWSLALPLAAALLATDASSFVLKELVARPRPVGGLYPDTEFAFPSGHAARAAAAAVVAWFVVSRRWAALTAAFALVMGFARLMEETHWFTDVLGGWAEGLAVASVVMLAWRRDFVGVRGRFEGWLRQPLARPP